ncbi:MAG: hypothetical protein ACRDOK_06370, partial [Streptosporangiaceae bacterium]
PEQGLRVIQRRPRGRPNSAVTAKTAKLHNKPPDFAFASYPGMFHPALLLMPGIYTVIWREPVGTGK